ncbi:MAG: flavohemoglobin expression-modulating QEGLA motif protein [Candidatus Nomurabacteria bacterium]|jgi:hypothetical protein|nr:flavohemoglobin expression-modulating QEGLA motif protein [Candidatus Nomurabacteria bacterium]
MEKQTKKEQFLAEPVDDNAYTTVNPTPETKYTDSLKSDASVLEGRINTLVGREWDFPGWEGEATDAMEAEKVRYNADVDYLYLLAHNSQDESRSIAERQQWADAFTEQSIKIYGRPDPDVAKIIEMGGSEQLMERYNPTLAAVKDWLMGKYGDVFDAMGLNEKTDKLPPSEIFDAFSMGLNKLKENDPRWSEWKIEFKPDATVLSCESAKKTIFIGEKRQSAEPKSLMGSFAHEVLRHAATAVNGEDLGVNSALPRYISLEEGFAMTFQIAMTGKTPTTSMNNYADIAWVLGDLDGEKHTRQELIERKLDRNRAKGKEITDKDITMAYNAANRLFRGTPGSDEVSGVFTKDISYFGGLVPALEFVKQGLEAGKDIDTIMSFANAAKFDPIDPAQKEYIESRILDRYLPKLPLALPPAPE